VGGEPRSIEEEGTKKVKGLYSRGMHPVAHVIKSQDKPSFATTSKTCFVACFYDHYMFRPSQEAIFR
jgi:hypothetical protein